MASIDSSANCTASCEAYGMRSSYSAVLEAHEAQADRAVAQVRVARLLDGVVVDVDHVVEHAHRRGDRLLELVLVDLAPSFRCCSRFTEPRLQTAVSVSLVFSVISVQRFDECTTPACCCGERTLQASLNVIQGWPVSNSIVSILRHRSVAWMVRAGLMSPRAALLRRPRRPSRSRRRTGRAGRARWRARTASRCPFPSRGA